MNGLYERVARALVVDGKHPLLAECNEVRPSHVDFDEEGFHVVNLLPTQHPVDSLCHGTGLIPLPYAEGIVALLEALPSLGFRHVEAHQTGLGDWCVALAPGIGVSVGCCGGRDKSFAAARVLAVAAHLGLKGE